MRWPGQATSYMIGMNKFLALRSRTVTANGSSDELRAFHRLVLAGAAMPMDILESVVDQAVAGGGLLKEE